MKTKVRFMILEGYTIFLLIFSGALLAKELLIMGFSFGLIGLFLYGEICRHCAKYNIVPFYNKYLPPLKEWEE